MRAAVVEAFGGPERVVLRELPEPRPRAGQLLVRVRAAALNPIDPKLRGGQYRFIFRLRPPYVAGFDFAGEVTAAGGASAFQVGDAVLGTLSAPGAFAESVAADERLVVPKPAALSFEQAAALPAAGLSAVQALRDLATLRPGQRLQSGHACGKVVVLP